MQELNGAEPGARGEVGSRPPGRLAGKVALITGTGRAVLVALPVLGLAVGCGSAGSPSEPTPTTAVVSSSVRSATVTPSSSATAKASLNAADGRRLADCADGNCEVLVESGDSLPNASGSGPVNVNVADGLVTLTQNSGGFSSTLSGTTGTTETLNRQVFLIVAIEGSSAVLRLRKT